MITVSMALMVIKVQAQGRGARVQSLAETTQLPRTDSPLAHRWAAKWIASAARAILRAAVQLDGRSAGEGPQVGEGSRSSGHRRSRHRHRLAALSGQVLLVKGSGEQGMLLNESERVSHAAWSARSIKAAVWRSTTRPQGLTLTSQGRGQV
jgi:hypothetical protein